MSDTPMTEVLEALKAVQENQSQLAAQVESVVQRLDTTTSVPTQDLSSASLAPTPTPSSATPAARPDPDSAAQAAQKSGFTSRIILT